MKTSENEMILKINKNWDAIVSYMDDEIREEVHADLAPCSNIDFLKAYIEKDPEFENCVLKNEFGIEL